MRDVGNDWDPQSIAARARALTPDLVGELERLAAIPSIAFPGYPPSEVARAHDHVVRMLTEAGVRDVGAIRLPDTPPVITGAIPAPEGAPTVLLYAHHDVQPPGDESLWASPPFTPTAFDDERGGGTAIRARGIADDKSNIVAHIGAIRAWNGRPPVGIRIVFEGAEEWGSPLDEYPVMHPDEFRSDAMAVADMGNIHAGQPTLTVALRGVADVVVEVRTLEGAKHSGNFGGPAPDAMLALVRALASLHDDNGDVAVEGLRREPWTGASYTDVEFSEAAGVEPGMPLLGTGTLGERLWSGPAITVTGIDAIPVDKAAGACVPYARAKINLRIHPEQPAQEARTALIRHLEAQRPFGIPLTVSLAGEAGDGYRAGTGGPAMEAMTAAMRAAYGSDPVQMAAGGAIPLVSSLHKAVPDAEMLLFGAQDGRCNLHAPNERVLVSELENTVVTEALFFAEFAARWGK
ncbi:M20/M25/M40 family metallo-hydrolase [Actinomadura oligospora]|uniref:M20/M25/M40 family metallo-hydrolase n=1 Tax=Actinomadura oligospora TaxID=111804 RepID=UPI0004B4C75A|nr:M20/M25/M40 family metallo-hydrolase [Actinomadura oligospora]